MRIAVVLACAALGCAGAPQTIQLGRAEAAIRVADEAGALGSDPASLYLGVARHDLAEARRLTSHSEIEGARRYCERAEIDAEIAAILAREADVRAAVQKSDGEAQALEDELDRTATRLK